MMSSQKRTYELKKRGESQQETRRRIVAATAALHEEVGPARTTVAEIARRAGVQRLTVYTHFPDESALFAACGGHFMETHPLPDLEDALGLGDPRERVSVVVRHLYGWYRENEPMTVNIERDRLLIPALDAVASRGFDQARAELAAALAAGFKTRGRRAERIAAILAVALDFWTWRRLDQQGLDDAGAADLMSGVIACIAGRTET